MNLNSPAFLPIMQADDRVGFIELDEGAYREASFLDARILTDNSKLEWLEWGAVKAQVGLANQCDFIFHLGHCGSTLLSRLLGEHPNVFSIREPTLFRDWVRREAPQCDGHTLMRLYTRVWRESQRPIIKMTSFVSDGGLQLIDNGQCKVVMLWVTPPVYIRTILAGQNARSEARDQMALRRRRLELRLDREVPVQKEGEFIAMAWLVEALSLSSIASGASELVSMIDFDTFLEEPESVLARAFTHIGADIFSVDLEALLLGPLMTRYSKGMDYAYSAKLRATLLARAGANEPEAFRDGMNWLQRLAQSEPRVEAVLQMSADVRRGIANVVGLG